MDSSSAKIQRKEKDDCIVEVRQDPSKGLEKPGTKVRPSAWKDTDREQLDDDARPEEVDVVQDIDGATRPHEAHQARPQPSRPGLLSALGRRSEGGEGSEGETTSATIPGAYSISGSGRGARTGGRQADRDIVERPETTTTTTTTTVVSDADRSHQLRDVQLRNLGVGGLGGSDYYLAEAVAVPDATCVHHEHDECAPESADGAHSDSGGDAVNATAARPATSTSGSGGHVGGSDVGGGDSLPGSVVHAESMDHKLVWSRRRAVLSAVAVAAAVLVLVGIVLGVVIPLSRSTSSTASSSVTLEEELPADIAAELEKGSGEVCIPDPTNCGCYNHADYVGNIAVTATGKECMRWDAQSPHEHEYNPAPSARYPELVENYCRNPSSSPGTWCYTTDPKTRWEYCNIPQCETYTVPIALSPVPPEGSFPLPSDLATSCEEKRPTSGLRFNGKREHIVIPNSSSSEGGLNLSGDPFTIEVWIKPKKKTDFSSILSNKEGGADKTGFLFSINTWQESDGRLYLEGTNSKVASTVSVQWGVWQHVAVTYDGTAPAFYLNGNQVSYYPLEFYGPFTIKPSWLDTKIGDMGLYYNGMVTAEINGYFSGVMDELRVWDHARSVDEIRAPMYCELSGAEPGLIAYYHFENEGEDLLDSSPNANHGRREGYTNFGGGYVNGMNLCKRCTSI